MRLNQKVAIVTGSTRGVGAEIARRYAREGARVVVTGRTSQRGQAVVEEIRAGGGEAVFTPSDLTSEDSVRELVEATVAAYGRVDILVNNAAATEMIPVGAKPVGELSTEEFEAGLRVAVYGTFWCAKYAIPRMVETGGGSVVNISSMTATRGFPCTPAYAASKGAVNALSRQMAADYGLHGVRVNTIIIGLVITELSAGVAGTPELARGTIGLQFVPRLGECQDVAHLAVYLGSDESTFITASEMTVDGGSTMKGPMLAASFELGTQMAGQGSRAGDPPA